MRDCVPILRREVELLRDAGVAIVQIDDPHLCLFVDARRASEATTTPTRAADFAVDMTNQVVSGIEDIKLAVHLCRRAGARARGDRPAFRGGYDPITLVSSTRLQVHHLTMEFTTPGRRRHAPSLRKLRPDLEIGSRDALAARRAKSIRSKPLSSAWKQRSNISRRSASP